MGNRKIIIGLIIAIVLALAALIVLIMWPKNTKTEVKVINKIKDYGYVLEDSETSIHKKYFEELAKTLKEDKVDEEAYAKLVVQLFVSDFYNLDNKITKNDIGGIQYVYQDAQENMILKAKDTIYKYVESNLYGTRKQKLPIVKDVTVDDVKKTEFTNEKTKKTDDSAYEVKASWTYKEDLDYQSEATFSLIHDGNKIGIVQIEEK